MIYEEGKPIGDILKKLFRELDIEDKYNEQRVLSHWYTLIGPGLASYTDRIYFYKGKLFVHLRSAALKQELHAAREKLIRELNDHVGKEVVEEIVFK